MHGLGGVADDPAEVLHDDLMSQAHAEDGQPVLEVSTASSDTPAVSGLPGPGEITSRSGSNSSATALRSSRCSCRPDRPVVVQPPLAEIVHEVVRERIEVVDEQDFLIDGSIGVPFMLLEVVNREAASSIPTGSSMHLDASPRVHRCC